MIEVSIAYDEALNSLSEFAQLLFLKVLPHTDDFGRFEGDPKTLKARVDPLAKGKIEKYERAMHEIAQAGLWLWYITDEGKKVIQFKTETFERINAFLIKNRGNKEYPEHMKSYQTISNDMLAYPIERLKTKAESKKQKEERPGDAEKKVYGEFQNVTLTDTERSGLSERLKSDERAKKAIEILSAYKKSTGKVYKSDYATFHTWVIQELEKRELKGHPPNGSTPGQRSTDNKYDRIHKNA